MRHIICLLLFYSCLHAAAAQDTLKIRPDREKHVATIQEIDIRELPEVIKQKISSDSYSSWILQAAFAVPADDTIATNDQDSIDYIVELKKDHEVIRIRFDDAGNTRNEHEKRE